MSVAELPELLQDDGDVDEFICHLYMSGKRVSLCGVHDSDDPHCQMHHDHKNVSPPIRPNTGPGEQCPTCGAPICEKCKTLWDDRNMLWRVMNAFR